MITDIAAALGQTEDRLHKARAGIGKLEDLLKQARKAGLTKDTETMNAISALGVIAGQIAAAELGLYEEHAKMTARAVDLGMDTGGPLSVLARHQPEIETRDSGGGR